MARDKRLAALMTTSLCWSNTSSVKRDSGPEMHSAPKSRQFNP